MLEPSPKNNEKKDEKCSNESTRSKRSHWKLNKGGFSWQRFIGISAFKARISRTIGIPLSRSGRQQKLGALTQKYVISPIVDFLTSLFHRLKKFLLQK